MTFFCIMETCTVAMLNAGLPLPYPPHPGYAEAYSMLLAALQECWVVALRMQTWLFDPAVPLYVQQEIVEMLQDVFTADVEKHCAGSIKFFFRLRSCHNVDQFNIHWDSFFTHSHNCTYVSPNTTQSFQPCNKKVTWRHSRANSRTLRQIWGRHSKRLQANGSKLTNNSPRKRLQWPLKCLRGL